MCFFLQFIAEIDKCYDGLFVKKFTDGSEGEDAIDSGFMARFGWLFNVKSVSEHEGIELNAVYDLPYLRFMNALAYLKAKSDWEQEEVKRMTKR